MDQQRDFDIVVYGATGFTGRLVAEYLAQHRCHGMPWAMAGRNADRLAAVRDEIDAPADTPLLIADSGDPASLRAMVARTRCVISTVGPYQHFGGQLVAACVEFGTDYVDLCGEPLWMRDMIAAHEDPARRSGARIVFSCGFDSVPFDLGVKFLQDAARERFGSTCPAVHGRVRAMNGEFSGGTAASLGATMTRLVNEPELGEALADPFCLSGTFRGPKQPVDNAVREDNLLGQWLAPFIMAVINSKNIHRSNLLMGHPYGEDFCYDEMTLAGSGEDGRKTAELLASLNPLTGKNTPAPGSGPSREAREAGNYDLLFVGTTRDGQQIRASVAGDMDPGYGSTSKIISEAAVCLVAECPELAGGVYTPAPAMGQKLIRRLQAHAGLTFILE